jgi:predicted membrane channel-forming protein YqfA (hemolysin III family)
LPLPLADISFGELLLIALEIFFFVVWIWILITILTDLFRDHELSGWAKGVWVLFLLVLPFLGAIIYLIARGEGMRERSIKEQADVKKHFDQYVRETAGGSSVDELHKLSDLKQRGDISDAEFEAAKAKLLV